MHSDLSRHHQGWDLYRVYRLDRVKDQAEFVIRHRIHHDTSYAFQSYAIAELYKNHEWQEISTLHYDQWAPDKDINGRWGTDGICTADATLQDRVCQTLGGALSVSQ